MGNVAKSGKANESLFYLAICIGMMISMISFTAVSGIFETLNGIWVLGSILIAGVLCFLIARQIAEIAGVYPAAPGIRTYILHGFNNNVSLLSVIFYVCFVIMIGGVESSIFATMVRYIFPGASSIMIVISIIMLVILVNVFGLEMSKNTQIISTSLLLLTLFVISLVGVLKIPDIGGALSRSSNNPSPLTFFSSLGISLFLFVGFEWVTQLGLNSKAYIKKIPQAMQTAIIINVVLYCLFSFAVIGNLSAAQMASTNTPVLLIAEKVLGKMGVLLALCLSIFATIATFNAGVLGVARITYGIAREGYLPKQFASISVKKGTPVFAIVSVGIIVIFISILVILLKYELVFTVVCSFIICMLYTVLLLSLLRIRKKRKKINYQSGMPGWAIYILAAILILFGIGSLFSMPAIQNEILIVLLIVVVLSLIFFSLSLLQKKKKVKAQHEK